MNRTGHTGKTDANHREIVAALLQAGCSVQTLASVGCGCPDLLVGHGNINFLLEVKDGSKPPSDRQLNDAEKKFIRAWRGQVRVVHSVDEALKAVGVCA